MGFFDQGMGGFDPMTGMPSYDPSTASQPPTNSAGSETAASAQADASRSSGSTWGKILNSIGIDSNSISNLFQGSPVEYGSTRQPVGGRIGSDTVAGGLGQLVGSGGSQNVGGQFDPSLGGDQNTMVAGGSPPAPPNGQAPTTTLSAAPRQPYASSMPGQVPLPTADPRNSPLPGSAPLGQGGIGSDSIAAGHLSASRGMPQTGAQQPPMPPGAQPQPQQQGGFLSSLLGGQRQGSGLLSGLVGGVSNQLIGGGDKGLAGLTPAAQQAMAGLAKGAANIQGSGKFASFARGAGQSLQGANQEATQQFNQNIAGGKLALQQNTFEAKKPIWMAQADYFQARAAQQRAVAQGQNVKQAWQSTPNGLAHLAEQEVQNRYNTDVHALQSQRQSLEPADYQKKMDALTQQRDANLKAAYTKYGIDPSNRGQDQEHPLDVSKYNPMQMQGMPHGTYFIVPGSKTKDNPNGIVKQRDYNAAPPPGYTPGQGQTPQASTYEDSTMANAG